MGWQPPPPCVCRYPFVSCLPHISPHPVCAGTHMCPTTTPPECAGMHVYSPAPMCVQVCMCVPIPCMCAGIHVCPPPPPHVCVGMYVYAWSPEDYFSPPSSCAIHFISKTGSFIGLEVSTGLMSWPVNPRNWLVSISPCCAGIPCVPPCLTLFWMPWVWSIHALMLVRPSLPFELSSWPSVLFYVSTYRDILWLVLNHQGK